VHMEIVFSTSDLFHDFGAIEILMYVCLPVRMYLHLVSDR